MEIFNCKESKKKRRALRKNMTEAEKALWKKLRGKHLEGLKFFRQYGIGAYIADFYCPQRKLVIEVDGGQHFSEEGKNYDAQREQYMSSLAYIPYGSATLIYQRILMGLGNASSRW